MVESSSSTGKKNDLASLPFEICDKIAWELPGSDAVTLTRLSKLMHNKFAGRAFYGVLFDKDGRRSNIREQVNSYIASSTGRGESFDLNEARTYARRVALSTFEDNSEDGELPRIIDDVIQNTPNLKQLCIELDDESDSADFVSAMTRIKEERPDAVPWKVKYLDVVATEQDTMIIIKNFSNLEVFIGTDHGFDSNTNTWPVLELLATHHPGLRGIELNVMRILYDRNTIQQAYARLDVILQGFPKLECLMIYAPAFEPEQLDKSERSAIYSTWTECLRLSLKNHGSMRRLIIAIEAEALDFLQEFSDEDEDEDVDKTNKYLYGLIEELERDVPGLENLYIELSSEFDDNCFTYAAVRNNGKFSIKVSAETDYFLMHGFLANLVHAKIWEPELS